MKKKIIKFLQSKDLLYKDESGQLASIYWFILSIAMFGMIYIFMGDFMYEITEVYRSLVDSGGFPTTATQIESMLTLQNIFKALPIVVVIAALVWTIKSSLRENSGVEY